MKAVEKAEAGECTHLDLVDFMLYAVKKKIYWIIYRCEEKFFQFIRREFIQAMSDDRFLIDRYTLGFGLCDWFLIGTYTDDPEIRDMCLDRV